MATIDSTAPDAAQSAPPPPDPHDELIDALYRLQGAISRVRVTAAARVARLDAAQHEQADELVMEELDEAYDAMDRAILHVEGPHRAPAAEAEETHEEPQASDSITADPRSVLGELVEEFADARCLIETTALAIEDSELGAPLVTLRKGIEELERLEEKLERLRLEMRRGAQAVAKGAQS